MTDEGTNSNNIILEQIVREERLIQEYEHELRRLQALSKRQPVESGLLDDSLRAILESVPNVDIGSSLLQSLTQEAPHDIQHAIRGFCFTNAMRQSSDIHILKGYFMADTSVEATIQIKIHRSGDSHSVAVKCSLDHEGHAWMRQHVCDNTLSFWIEGVSNYLQFDKKRTQFLVEHKFEFERKESRVRIQLSDFLTVYWDWKWKRGEDALRLPTSLPPSTIIQPRKLEALVQVCKGNCLDALKLLRQTLTTGHRMSSSLHEDTGSDENSSESDSWPVSLSKPRLLKTPPVRMQIRKRKRKSGYSDDMVSGDDSSESDSLPASPSKPTQMQVKKRRRKSGYLDIVMAKRKKR